MNETVFDRIELIERYATKQEKVIIEFLRTHPIKDLLLFSITEFSEKVGVGDATMLRFCRKLGLRGYSEFRFLLSQSTEDQDGTAGNDADEILSGMITALHSTHELLNQETIQKAAEMILKADTHFQTIAASLLEEQDVMILFSVSGGTKDMLDIAKQASQQGVKLVIVTNHLKSPLAKYADALLYVVAKSAPLNSGSLISKISQLYVIDVLSREIRREMGSKAENSLKKTALAVMDKEV